jgi:hypothetical protein
MIAPYLYSSATNERKVSIKKATREKSWFPSSIW